LLSALDPGKQGLKLGERARFSVGGWLSALDPGKQGLKPVYLPPPRKKSAAFQRLIQENKD